jgi:GTPase SAR1 family protein
LNRPVHIINLDPAVPNPPYPCSINLTEIVTLEDVMEEYGLGPNGGMLYCVEYLEANLDWLIGRLDEVLGQGKGEDYVIFDTPGQVELWTNHESFRRIFERLSRMDYRVGRSLRARLCVVDGLQLVVVHLSDAHYITDASKFISVALLSVRAMMQMELPHVNVLSKIDLLSQYGDLREYFGSIVPRVLMDEAQHLICDITPNAGILDIFWIGWTMDLGRERWGS